VIAISEMFPDEIISNLPKNPDEGLKILIEGYIKFVEDAQFTPHTHFEKCMDGYALISAYNKSYELGLNLLSTQSEDKKETIQALNASIIKIQNELGNNKKLN